ncbi:MAG: SNF2-related protein, partial [Caldilineaceae bacterium]
MGSGKTVTTLTFLDGLYNLDGETSPAIVFAPKRVAQSVWPEEVKEWAHLTGLEVSAVVGTAEERAAALRRDVPIYAMGYDNIPWLAEHLAGAWPYRTVIADEAVRLKSFRLKQGGVRASVLGKIAHTKVQRWINLTGKPAPNGMIDLWGQQWFIDKGERLGLSYSGFEERWFAWKGRKGDAFGKDRILVPGAEEFIQERLADCTITVVNPLGVDEPVFVEVPVHLSRPVKAKYKEFEKEMFAFFDDVGVEGINAAGKSMKCLQIASGFIYPNSLDGEPRGPAIDIHDEKIEALKSILAEANGMPLLVAYHWAPDLKRLLKAFPRGRALDDKPQTIKDWNEGRIPILFAHPQSCGHGLNLQHGSNLLVFY